MPYEERCFYSNYWLSKEREGREGRINRASGTFLMQNDVRTHKAFIDPLFETLLVSWCSRVMLPVREQAKAPSCGISVCTL